MAEQGSEGINWRRANRFMIFCGTLAVIAVMAAVVYYALLLPIALSAFITYLLLPLITRLERFGIQRWVATLILIVVSLGVLSLAVTLIVPLLYKQALLLVRLIPVAFDTMMKNWVPLAEKYVADLGILKPEEVHQYIVNFNVLGKLETQLQSGLAGLWSTGTTLAGGAVNLVLVPFLSFFMLIDYERIAAGARTLVPRDLVLPSEHVMHRVNLTLRSVIKGQVTVAGILAVLYVVGFSLAGLQSAIAIGVVAGLCRVIPYFDVIVGCILSTIVILSDFHGWGQVIGVTIVFLVVQAVDGAFITPRVIGERVGLHPMAVVLSVLAFADWFGFWGVLVAIPVVAIVKVLLSAATPYYKESRLYYPWQARDGRKGDNL